jgi:hypothetical protein
MIYEMVWGYGGIGGIRCTIRQSGDVFIRLYGVGAWEQGLGGEPGSREGSAERLGGGPMSREGSAERPGRDLGTRARRPPLGEDLGDRTWKPRGGDEPY